VRHDAVLSQDQPMTDLRIGDTEREGASNLLSEHYTLGRLSHDELLQRLDLATTARTASELRQVTRDLPALPRTTEVAPLPPTPQPNCYTYLMEVALFGLAVVAGVCLLGLVGSTMHSYQGILVVLGALGGATVAGTAVHFAHRVAATRR
jgi:hypothetical protein